MRPYLLFVSAMAGLLGQAFVPHPTPWVLWTTTFVLFWVYGFGQALTDVDQTDTDALSSPYRPLVSGTVRRDDVLFVSLSLLGICAVLLSFLSINALWIGGLQVIGLRAYTFFKRRWWAGPPWNSWIVACVALLGFAVHFPNVSLPSLFEIVGDRPDFVAAILCLSFSYQVFVLIGYLKDVEADRATEYHTLAVAYGRKTTVLVSLLSGCLAVASALMAMAYIGEPLIMSWNGFTMGSGLFLIGITEMIRSHIRGWRVTEDQKAFPAVESSVRACLALTGALIAYQKTQLGFVAIGMMLGFELALRLRPFPSQV